MALTPSSLIFDKYQVVRRMTAGGMGEVFLARQFEQGGKERQVVLKSLLPALAAQAPLVEQFLEEARLAAGLSHPNVVRVHHVGLWQGTYFIAMEYISGHNLSQVVRALALKGRGLPVGVWGRILHDAALGLDHAHRAKDGNGQPLKLVHRDVSPQNLMVSEEGITKVVDFGIAHAADREASKTSTGVLKGKLAYMSPEQIHKIELDGRSDVFSLGVVAWETLSGQRLFGRSSVEIEVMQNVLSMPVPALSSINPKVPRVLDGLVARMLARNIESRFPSAGALADALAAILPSLEQSDHAAVGAVVLSLDSAEPAQADVLSPTGPGRADFLIDLSGPTPGSPVPRDAEPTVAERKSTGERRVSRSVLERHELQIAGKIQSNLLPRKKTVPAFDVAWTLLPSADVGADYFDVIPTQDGCVVAIGDVAGHGLTAGLLMLTTQSVVSALVHSSPAVSPKEIVVHLNRVLHHNIHSGLGTREYLTFSAIRIYSDGRVVHAGAHEDLMVKRAATGKVEAIPTQGVWLGAIADVAKMTHEQTITLNPKDLLVAYTDGLLNARDQSKVEFGQDRIVSTLEAMRTVSAEQTCFRLMRAVEMFSEERTDDRSVVVLRFLGPPQSSSTTM